MTESVTVEKLTCPNEASFSQKWLPAAHSSQGGGWLAWVLAQALPSNGPLGSITEAGLNGNPQTCFIHSCFPSGL